MKKLTDCSLSQYSSLNVGGTAKRLVILEKNDKLVDFLSSYDNSLPIWILGQGTNVLISDDGLPGTVIINNFGMIENIDSTLVRVDSGVIWDDFVSYVISKDLWGLEFASGIPGGVGAAIVGNIAAYGHKVSDALYSATVYDMITGSTEVWRNQDFNFEYRSSRLKEDGMKNKIILDATFKLSTKPTGKLEYQSALKVSNKIGVSPDTLQNRRMIILETRKMAGSILQNYENGPWTAGSFFKNPIVSAELAEAIITNEEKNISSSQINLQNMLHSGDEQRVSAAHVLLAAGLKRGQKWGRVRLHPDHVLKIENTGGATANDIYNVAQLIMTTVKQALGIELEPEVKYLGNFNTTESSH